MCRIKSASESGSSREVDGRSNYLDDRSQSVRIKDLVSSKKSHLTFDRHINEMTKKTMGALHYIDRHKDLFNKESRIMVIQTLVLRGKTLIFDEKYNFFLLDMCAEAC